MPRLAGGVCRGVYLRLPGHVRVNRLCGRDVGRHHLAGCALLFAPHLAQSFQQLGRVLANQRRDVLQRVTAQRVKPFAPIVLHQREFECIGVFKTRLFKQVVAL